MSTFCNLHCVVVVVCGSIDIIFNTSTYNHHHTVQVVHSHVCTLVNAWLVEEKDHQCKLQRWWQHGCKWCACASYIVQENTISASCRQYTLQL